MKVPEDAWAMSCHQMQDRRAALLNSQCKLVIRHMGVTADEAGGGIAAVPLAGRESVTAGDRVPDSRVCCHRGRLAQRYALPVVRFYLAISFSAFNGRILITLRAGLALNICSCLVKGLIPMRALVAGF
jgi:hypothetical protein